MLSILRFQFKQKPHLSIAIEKLASTSQLAVIYEEVDKQLGEAKCPELDASCSIILPGEQGICELLVLDSLRPEQKYLMHSMAHIFLLMGAQFLADERPAEFKLQPWAGTAWILAKGQIQDTPAM